MHGRTEPKEREKRERKSKAIKINSFHIVLASVNRISYSRRWASFHRQHKTTSQAREGDMNFRFLCLIYAKLEIIRADTLHNFFTLRYENVNRQRISRERNKNPIWSFSSTRSNFVNRFWGARFSAICRCSSVKLASSFKWGSQCSDVGGGYQVTQSRAERKLDDESRAISMGCCAALFVEMLPFAKVNSRTFML